MSPRRTRREQYKLCYRLSSKRVCLDRFEIKKKLKTAKKKEKEEKKRKQEEEQEKRKLSQVQDAQVVSVRAFDGWTSSSVHPRSSAAAALHTLMGVSCFWRQVMSHNKERRSKRDEKLDKKSQAMEELKAEREKKKNKTGGCLFPTRLGRAWAAER